MPPATPVLRTSSLRRPTMSGKSWADTWPTGSATSSRARWSSLVPFSTEPAPGVSAWLKPTTSRRSPPLPVKTRWSRAAPAGPRSGGRSAVRTPEHTGPGLGRTDLQEAFRHRRGTRGRHSPRKGPRSQADGQQLSRNEQPVNPGGGYPGTPGTRRLSGGRSGRADVQMPARSRGVEVQEPPAPTVVGSIPNVRSGRYRC
jgi:hypothetical protein